MKKSFPSTWDKCFAEKWHWHLQNTGILEPWFKNYPRYEQQPVKKNPLRCVFKVQASDGMNYFIKHDKPKGFLSCLKAWFRSKSYAEMQSFMLLKNAGIPCVEYVGYGEYGKESMLVTKALDGFMSCQEYWYRYGGKDLEKAELFFQQLCRLIRLLLERRIHHPDFHSANLMIHPESMDIVLIDLYGVDAGTGSKADMECLLQIFWDFSEGLSPEQISVYMGACGLTWSVEEKQEFWQMICQKKLKYIEHEWQKRKRQILSGNSKFCRTQTGTSRSDSCVIIRNTPWFSVCERDLESLRVKKMPHGDAEKIWLDSFRQQLEHREIKKCPLAWQQNPDGSDCLFF